MNQKITDKSKARRYPGFTMEKEPLALISTKEEQITKLTEELRAQRLLTERLQVQLESLLRILYGKKSEKNQTESNTEKKDKLPKGSGSKTESTQNGPSRKKLPDHLEREVIKY